MKKKVITRYNTHKKLIMTHKNYKNRIIEMFIEYIYIYNLFEIKIQIHSYDPIM